MNPVQQGVLADPGQGWCHSHVPPQAQQQPGWWDGRVPRPLFGQDVTSTYLNSNPSSGILWLSLPQECGLLPGKLFLHVGFSLRPCLWCAHTGTKTRLQ